MRIKPFDRYRGQIAQCLAWGFVGTCLTVSGTVHGQGGAPTQPSPAAGAAATSPADEAAVRSAMQAFAKAFEARDAKALAAFWTANGEYVNSAGLTLQGREALESAFAEFFAKTPEVSAQVQSDTLRFLSAGLAIDEGTVQVRRGPTEAGLPTDYRALLVREGSQWRLAELSESTRDEVSIEDLGWLIGEWQAASGQGVEVRTLYSWEPNHKFIRVVFSVKGPNLDYSGNQAIGVDPATGQLHTWTFEADGGVAEAEWTRDGDHWLQEVTGTLTDGSTLTETNVLRRVNDDLFTWQAIDRYLDEQALDDLPPVKVVRLKPAK